ncbi:unnamed protein product [Acanthoscelides obtectus]|uniref:Gustatory receptor n=1 Tax=Acanthoscelides obtectus TaxID=200917 RepID=A0A9P0K2T9_ACAOB|nr:unnamed protein product [Acanthoscelides obtectus]CAK1663446.1 hypothetical protein AOBTE_LOCUS23666 [Acanthoscelides obtectus]
MFLGELILSEELFSVLQPVLVVSRWLGIFPVSYKRFGNFYKLRWSTWYAIYSYILSLSLTITTLVNLIIDLEKGEKRSIRMPNRKTRFVTCVDISIVIFIVMFGIATLPLKIKKIWKTMNFLNETDKILLLKNSDRFRKSSIYFIVLVFALTLIIFIYDVSSWLVVLRQQSKNPLEYLRAYFCFYCLYIVMLAKEMLYWHIIFFIKIKISTLNARLRELKKVGSYKERMKFKADPNGLERWAYLNKGVHKVNGISPDSVCTTGISLSLGDSFFIATELLQTEVYVVWFFHN